MLLPLNRKPDPPLSVYRWLPWRARGTFASHGWTPLSLPSPRSCLRGARGGLENVGLLADKGHETLMSWVAGTSTLRIGNALPSSLSSSGKTHVKGDASLRARLRTCSRPPLRRGPHQRQRVLLQNGLAQRAARCDDPNSCVGTSPLSCGRTHA